MQKISVRHFLISCILSLLIAASSVNFTYAVEREYVIKAVFLYNFLNYITWPKENAEDELPQVNLCVYGRDPFGEVLTELQKKATKQRKINIERLKRSETRRFSSCHILYVSHSEHPYITDIKEKIASQGVLSVSDIQGFATQSGIIELTKRKDSVKLIINAKRLKKAGLSASSKLMSIAQVIRAED